LGGHFWLIKIRKMEFIRTAWSTIFAWRLPV
jgi:hypothetical protein